MQTYTLLVDWLVLSFAFHHFSYLVGSLVQLTHFYGFKSSKPPNRPWRDVSFTDSLASEERSAIENAMDGAELLAREAQSVRVRTIAGFNKAIGKRTPLDVKRRVIFSGDDLGVGFFLPLCSSHPLTTSWILFAPKTAKEYIFSAFLHHFRLTRLKHAEISGWSPSEKLRMVVFGAWLSHVHSVLFPNYGNMWKSSL